MKKKILGLLLAAFITTGIGGFGTFAIFSGNAKYHDQVNITMGSLEVKAQQSAYGGQWRKSDGKSETKDTATESINKGNLQQLTFTNVKPGDEFVKTVQVSNYGTLKADTTVKLVNQYPSDALEVTVTPYVNYDKVVITGDQINGFNMILPPHEKPEGWCQGVLFEIKVKVKDVGNWWQNKTIDLGNFEFLNVDYKQVVK